MKQITIYYWPSYVYCGECGQVMMQVDEIRAGSKQRWAIMACQNFYARPNGEFPLYDSRNNCVNYGVRVKIHATEKMLEVVE